jgi:hypothetical protein
MFVRGQKVVCINADGAPQLTLNAIYTIKEVLPVLLRRWMLTNETGDMAAVTLHEVEPSALCCGFDLRRFRPAVSKKTDISIFTRMLTTKKVKVRV